MLAHIEIFGQELFAGDADGSSPVLGLQALMRGLPHILRTVSVYKVDWRVHE